MDMYRRNHGFTIVEIAVVIAAIGIIMSIILVAFNTTQQRARDDKRESDIKTLSVLLEAYYDKNGEYPTDSYLNYWLQPGRILEPSISASGSVIGSDTTLTALRSVLGISIADSFGDPTRTSPDYLLNNVVLTHTGYDHRYAYIGGAISKTGGQYGAPLNFTGKSGTFRCDFRVNSTANQPSSYALGHYEEATDKWIFYLGSRGAKVEIYDFYDASCFTHVTVKNA